MIKNYVKIAWRSLRKNRGISLINIAGLSLSLAFCLLLYFFIRQEQSYDSFHAKSDRLFRLEMTDVYSVDKPKEAKGLLSFLTKNEEAPSSISFPLVVGPDLQAAFSEIKSITRFKDASSHFGDAMIRADKLVYK